MNWLRVLFVGGLTSYRALFNWMSPWVFFPILVVYPLFQILFFAYLGRYAGVGSDEFFLIGNTFIAAATAGLFGMGHSVAGERRSQTLASILASPASRLALFLGRALPSILTGFAVSVTSFALGALVLDVEIAARAVAGLSLAILASSFACTAMGLCLGAIGLRGRNVSLFADVIAGSMLLVAGANVPLDRLPGWIQATSSVIPLTRGIEAARDVAAGASLSDVSGLLLAELGIGMLYLVAGLALLRLFEFESRRSATLEAF
ncbi:MAG: ABC transporter permease [Gaiellaceae bacterium]